jgi:hypothetical protein
MKVELRTMNSNSWNDINNYRMQNTMSIEQNRNKFRFTLLIFDIIFKGEVPIVPNEKV